MASGGPTATDPPHNLAIELEHKTQYAVCRRVLGPEIDSEIAQSSAMAASRQLRR
jgi:hypothetical protein